jgi:HEAT repeat-containing protein 5
VILHAVGTSMESDGAIVLRTIDGLDALAPEPSNRRKEPAALFFVLFGLAFEALVGSSSDDLPSVEGARQNTKIALKVLKHLVKPAYSGTNFVEGPIFEEFISVSYRIAMTDPADVRSPLVEVLSSIVESREGVLPPDECVDSRAWIPAVYS